MGYSKGNSKMEVNIHKVYLKKQTTTLYLEKLEKEQTKAKVQYNKIHI